MRLDIGSGIQPLAGHLGVDIDPRADVCAHMGRLPFPDSSVDGIYSSHALEHVSKFEVVHVLREWWRVIKPGHDEDGRGRVIVRVPNLVYALQYWLDYQEKHPADCDGWEMALIFGSQTQDGGQTIHEGEFHKTGFTETLLRRYVGEAGLTVVKFEMLWTHTQETLSMECIKE